MSTSSNKAAAILAKVAAARKATAPATTIAEVPVVVTNEMKIPDNPIALNSTLVSAGKRVKFVALRPGLTLYIGAKAYQFENEIFSTLHAHEAVDLRAFAALNPSIIREL